MPRIPAILDYATITIANTGDDIVALGSLTVPAGAKSFVGTLETAQVRARGDGTAPTTSEGELIEVGSKIILSESEFENMLFIRTTSTSGVLKGHFYTAEPEYMR
jgi:hypothetical protein